MRVIVRAQGDYRHPIQFLRERISVDRLLCILLLTFNPFLHERTFPMSRISRRRFLVTASSVAGSMPLTGRIGWSEPEKAATGDLRLWYTAPASEWVEALPIGNGRLGAMIYGGSVTTPADPAKETLQLNEDTLWSGMPVDGNNLQARQYLPTVRQAVLEEKDYHKADQLCTKMQGLFAEAYQVIGSLHVDCKQLTR